MGKNLKISVLLDFYGKLLTEKQRNVIDFYYNEDLSLAEISEHTFITRQGVRDSIKRGEAILLEAEEKLGFYQRYCLIRDAAMEMEKACDEMMELNEKKYFITEFDEKLALIKKQADVILDDEEKEEQAV